MLRVRPVDQAAALHQPRVATPPPGVGHPVEPVIQHRRHAGIHVEQADPGIALLGHAPFEMHVARQRVTVHHHAPVARDHLDVVAIEGERPRRPRPQVRRARHRRRGRRHLDRHRRDRAQAARIRHPEREAVRPGVTRRRHVDVGAVRAHRHRAVRRIGLQAVGQRTGRIVHVACRQPPAQRAVRQHPRRTRIRNRRIVHRRHRHRRHLRRRPAVAVRDNVLEGRVAGEVRRRRERHVPVAVQAHIPRTRIRHRRDGQRIAVRVRLVRQQHRSRDRQRRVFRRIHRLARPRRRVVHRRDIDCRRRARAAAIAVGDRVVEARRPVEVRIRREQHVAVAVEAHTAARRVRYRHDRQRIAVDIRLVRQQARRRDHLRHVLDAADRLVRRHRRGVELADLHRHRRRRRAPVAVRDHVIERPPARERSRRREHRLAIDQRNRAVHRVRDRLDRKRIPVRVPVVSAQRRRVQTQHAILGNRRQVVGGLRRVVHARHTHRRARRRLPAMAVRDHVLEARLAREVRIRREHHIAVAVEAHAAARRVAHGCQRQRVAVHIRRARQQVGRRDRLAGILRPRERRPRHHRRIVHRTDINRHRRRRFIAQAVAHRVAEARLARVIRVRREGHIAVAVQHDRTARPGGHRDQRQAHAAQVRVVRQQAGRRDHLARVFPARDRIVAGLGKEVGLRDADRTVGEHEAFDIDQGVGAIVMMAFDPRRRESGDTGGTGTVVTDGDRTVLLHRDAVIADEAGEYRLVIAVAAVERVVAGATDHTVIAVEALDQVIRITRPQHVVAVGRGEVDTAAFRPADVLDGAGDRVAGGAETDAEIGCVGAGEGVDEFVIHVEAHDSVDAFEPHRGAVQAGSRRIDPVDNAAALHQARIAAPPPGVAETVETRIDAGGRSLRGIVETDPGIALLADRPFQRDVAGERRGVDEHALVGRAHRDVVVGEPEGAGGPGPGLRRRGDRRAGLGDRDVDGAGVRPGQSVPGAEREAVGARETGVGGVGVAAVGGEAQGAAGDARDHLVGEVRLRRVDVSGADLPGDRLVDIDAQPAGHGHRRIRLGGDRDGHRRLVVGIPVIKDTVGEGVGAVEIRIRRVEILPAAQRLQGAESRVREKANIERIAVGIDIVREELGRRDDQRRVLVGGEGIVAGGRGVVDAPDGEGLAARRGQTGGVRQGVLEPGGTEIVGGGREADEAGVEQFHRAAGRAADSGDGERVAIRVAIVGEQGGDAEVGDRVLVDLRAAEGRCRDRRIRRGCKIDGDGALRMAAAAVGDGIIEGRRAEMIGGRREDDVAAAIECDGSTRRVADGGDGNRIAFRVAVVGEQGRRVDDERGVFGAGEAVVDGNRRRLQVADRKHDVVELEILDLVEPVLPFPVDAQGIAGKQEGEIPRLPGEDYSVVPRPTVDQIVPGTADQRILARSPDKRVVAGLAIQDIVAAAARDRIVAAAGMKRVVEPVADDDVIAVSGIDVLDVRAGGDRQLDTVDQRGLGTAEIDPAVAGDRRGVDRVNAAVVGQICPGDFRWRWWRRWWRRGAKCFQGGFSIEPPARRHTGRQRRNRIDAVHQQRPDFLRRQRVVHRQQQGRHPGDMRRRHGGAAQGPISVTGRGRVDAGTGRREINRGAAVVREPGQAVIVVCRGDRDDVGEVVARRIMRRGIGIDRTVAGRRDEHGACIAGRGNGVPQPRRIPAATPAVVGDIRTHLGGVLDRPDGVVGGAAAAGAQELQRHDLGGPGNAGHAGAVVAARRYGAGDMGAVIMVVVGIAVVVDEVVAVIIVDIAVAVIIDAVAGDLAGVAPHVGGEVGMRPVDAGVDDADNDAAAGGVVPRLRRIDIRVGAPAGLAGIVQPPELAEGRVVRGRVRFLDGIDADDVVRLDIFEYLVVGERGNRRLHRSAGVDLPELDSESARRGIDGCTERLGDRLRLGLVVAGAQLDDDLALDPFGVLVDDGGRGNALGRRGPAAGSRRGSGDRGSRQAADVAELVGVDVGVIIGS